MVVGIIIANIFLGFVLTAVLRAVKLQGYKEGMLEEGRQWIAAFDKVTVPNWQCLSTDDIKNPEDKKIAAKLYVLCYKDALRDIKEEVIVNRWTQIQDSLNGTLL